MAEEPVPEVSDDELSPFIKFLRKRTGLICILFFVALVLVFSEFQNVFASVNHTLLALAGESRGKFRGADDVSTSVPKDFRPKKGKKKIPTKTTTTSNSSNAKSNSRKDPANRTRAIAKGFFYRSAKQAQSAKNKLSIKKKEQVVIGDENWKNSKDCSATAYVYVDDKVVGVKVHVVDDKLFGKDGNSWENDSVEFYFDVRPRGKRGSKGYEKGVFQIIYSPDFVEVNPDTISQNRTPKMGIKASCKVAKNKKSYDVWMTIPLADLAEHHYPISDEFNFDIGLNDSDGNRRETQMMWSGENNNYQSAEWFGKLQLKE